MLCERWQHQAHVTYTLQRCRQLLPKPLLVTTATVPSARIAMVLAGIFSLARDRRNVYTA
jgi:hypothetical protein